MEFLRLGPQTAPPAACALQQHPFYGRTLRTLGVKTQMWAARDCDQTVATVQIVERRLGPVHLRWMPRGPVWSPAATAPQKSAVLTSFPGRFPNRALWVSNAESTGDAPLFAAQGHRPLLTAQYVAEIDLTQPPDARQAAQHGKWRNRLRHAGKSGLQVNHRSLDPVDDLALLELEAAQRRARRYTSLPPSFTQAWYYSNARATRLFVATRDNTVEAYILVLLHAPTATYHLGWTSPEGRRHSAHNLLLWQASNWLAKKGCTRFDLGSVDTQNCPGLARFKIGSGAAIRALGPTFLHMPRPRLRRPAQRAAA